MKKYIIPALLALSAAGIIAAPAAMAASNATVAAHPIAPTYYHE